MIRIIKKGAAHNRNLAMNAHSDLCAIPDRQHSGFPPLPAPGKYGRLLLFLLLFCLFIPCRGDQAQKAPRILYINSYHPGYTWSDMIFSGMRDTLTNQYGQQYDLRVEHLDAKRYGPELAGELGETIRSAWRAKYSGLQIDILLVSDQDGYNFINRARDDLFPGIPLIFSGVEKPGKIAPNTTGVLNSTDYVENLALILKVLPNMKELWVITDPSTTGVINRSRFADAAEEFSSKIKISYFDANNQGIMPNSLIKKAASLGDGAAIFFLDYYRTPDNDAVDVTAFLEKLCDAAKVPVFSHVDMHIDFGVTGGYMNSGVVQGRQVAELASRVIEGVDISSLQPEIEQAAPIFAEQKLKQFGIPPKNLPKKSSLKVKEHLYPVSYSRAFPGILSEIIYARGDYGYPPFEFINSKGEPDGFNVEIIKAVADAMGLEVRIELGIWDEVRQQLEAGDIDLLIGMFNTPERDRKVDFSIPMLRESYAVYVRDDSSIQNIRDLKDKTVILQKSDLAYDYCTEHQLANRIIEKSEWAEVLLSLSEGEGDAAMVSRLQGNHFIKQQRLTNLKAVGPPVIQRKYCMAVTEGNSQLLAQINGGLSLIKTSGEYDRIYQKWFGVMNRNIDVALIIKRILLWIVFPFIVLLSIALGFSWMLRRQVQRKTGELKESEKRFRDIFEAMPFPAVVVRMRDGKYLEVNDAHVQKVGLPRSEIIGKSTFDMGADPGTSNQQRNQLLESGRVDGLVIETRKGDGTSLWIQYSACLAELDGEQVAITGTIDITDRKLAEESLRISENKLRALFAAMQDVVLVLDSQGRYIEIAPTSTDQLYRPHDQLLGKTLIDILPEEQATAFMKCIHDVLARDSRRSLDYQLEITGQPVWFSASISPYTSNCVLWVARDITDHKRAETEREKLQEQLNQSQKMESVGRLAGGVAHDFNNMLGAIMGYAEMALERVGDDQILRGDLEEIIKATQRSADLTRQLLAFARKQTVTPKVLDLNETVEGMLKMLRRLIGENIDFIWRPAKQVGPILMDPSQMDQILANLCVNARDAIADTGRITIETDSVAFDEAYCEEQIGIAPGEYVQLVVSDNGCGMDKEILSMIYEPFFTTKKMGKGTGLGLATVYGIVKQNNGFINVYSELGHGTTFRIYLPKTERQSEPAQVKQVPTPFSPGSETILFVEDEPMIRELGKTMLETMGYKVLEAPDSEEAIRLAQGYSERIDLLITDVVMPGMNGRDLATILLASYPELKILFMSGYTADIISRQGVLIAGTHFIQKPFSRNQLSAIIKEVLGSQ
jgi:PAS domain S-box-containing protein